MGKRNSKLKQDTIDRLTTATYCKYFRKAFELFGELLSFLNITDFAN